MFTFDDLRRVDARAMRDLLREVATGRLTVALKGLPPKRSRSHFLPGLSARAAEENSSRTIWKCWARFARTKSTLREAKFSKVALRLEAEGKIDLGRESE